MVKPRHLHHRRFPFEKRKHVRVLKRRNVCPSWSMSHWQWMLGQLSLKAKLPFLVLGSRLPHSPSSLSSSPRSLPRKTSSSTSQLHPCLRANLMPPETSRPQIEVATIPESGEMGPPTRGQALLNLSNAGSKDQCNPSIPRLTGPQAMPTCMNFGQG